MASLKPALSSLWGGGQPSPTQYDHQGALFLHRVAPLPGTTVPLPAMFPEMVGCVLGGGELPQEDEQPPQAPRKLLKLPQVPHPSAQPCGRAERNSQRQPHL